MVKENEKSEAIFSLDKYWIRADLMRCNLIEAKKSFLLSLYTKIFDPIRQQAPLFYGFYQQRHDGSVKNTYWVYWLAGIYCVMEGYKKLRLNYKEVDSYLNLNDLRKKLKNYRDNTYHFTTQKNISEKTKAYKKVHEKLPELIEFHNTIGGLLHLKIKSLNNLPREQLNKEPAKKLFSPSSTITPEKFQMNQKTYSFYEFVFFNFMQYWEQANVFRHHFYIELNNPDRKYDIHLFAYMDYWYGALWSLIEGYKELGYSHNQVKLLITSNDLVLTNLKAYRHSTFHYEKIYNNSSLTAGLLEDTKSVKWLTELHDAFNDYVIKELLKPDIQGFIVKKLLHQI